MSVAEDRLEILDLIARYSHMFDGGDAEGWANVFTEDGKLTGRVGQPDQMTLSGRRQFTAFMERANLQRGTSQHRHHQSTTMFVEMGEDRAVTRTYLLVTTVHEGKPPVLGLTSIYQDEHVRTPQGWRIKTRQILPDVKGVLADIVKSRETAAGKE